MFRQLPGIVAACLVMALQAGCVRRTIIITSEPSGALVILNDQEIGRTPAEADFKFYGDYDVRLTLDGYEPINTVGRARAPLWDHVPIDLVAEMVPGEPHSRIHWHYELVEAGPEAEGMLERAMGVRERSNADLPRDAEVAEPAGDEAVDGRDAGDAVESGESEPETSGSGPAESDAGANQ